MTKRDLMFSYTPPIRYYWKTTDHFNIGELTDVLGMLPSGAVLYAGSRGYYPDLELHSYRGYPEDFEFDSNRETVVTIGDFYAMLMMYLNAKTVIEGYKGGDYPVVRDAYLWLGYEGGTNECALVGVGINKDGSYTLLGRSTRDC